MEINNTLASMLKAEAELISKYQEIKAQGFVRSNRAHNTGVGKTFEDLAGIRENNVAGPDYEHMEVKSYRELSKAFVTLFTKSPDHPNGANTLLRTTFGYKDSAHGINRLHTSFFATTYNNCKKMYGFRLVPDDSTEKLFISVKDILNDRIVSKDAFFHYATLRSNVDLKTTHLALVAASCRSTADYEEFHFNKFKLLRGKGFERFLMLVKEGKIRFDIRMGFHKSGAKFGQTHDHGSGFRINKRNIADMFDTVYED